MTTSSTTNATFTTNDDDQNEVSKLKNRLKEINAACDGGATFAEKLPLPSVEIADGVHKYVLIKAERNDHEQYFVTSKKGASYHRNAAEPLIDRLQIAGYINIEVTGGGRLSLDNKTKKIHIYGFSYGFGLADHAISKSIILDDPRYSSFDVTYSNDGY
jgi:phosphohistidine phosphatase